MSSRQDNRREPTRERDAGAGDLRLAELMGILSLAIDLGMGLPLELGLRSCLLGIYLGRELGLPADVLRQVYYLTLLGVLGCNAEVHEFAQLFGDEIAIRPHFAPVDLSKPADLLGVMLRHVGEGRPIAERSWMLAKIVATGGSKAEEFTRAHCEVAERLAERLGFGRDIQQGLAQMFERWNGQGMPRRLKGEEIPLSVRVAHVAQNAAISLQYYGPTVAIDTIRRRAGIAYDPAMAECFCCKGNEILARLDPGSCWDMVMENEPEPWQWIVETQLDLAARAIADFTDLKSPYLAGHSSGVGELVASAANCAGFPEAEIASLRRAGFVHDIGRVAVSARIWGKEGPLTNAEWERVRLHPYYTERVLAQSKALTPLGQLAALHHERLDGSGYHRGVPASLQGACARILAAADVYHAMLEPRPHRLAHSPEKAASALEREVREGHLDRDAVNAVLAAAGQKARRARRAWPEGLSEREVEVLRLIARGLANRQMADWLGISKVTVGHHIQHIYDKIGVSTRAGATLFAMQHDLLEK